MAQPTQQQEHLDAILTNISVAYLQNAMNYIASRVFPNVFVDKESDKYYVFDKNAFLTDSAKIRAPGDESAGSGYTLSRDNYSCDVFALHKDIPDRVRKNADSPLNPDRNATQYITQQFLTRKELQFVTDYMTTGIWGTDVTGVTDFAQWSNYSSSDPINDVETGKEKILGQTGFEANTLVLGYSAFRQLKNHPDLVDRIKYTSEKTITADMMAALFDIDQVLVAKAVKATNLENETAAYSFAFGKTAFLCYSAPEPGLEVPSAGYTFTTTTVSGDLGKPVGIKRFRLEERSSDRVEGEMGWDNKVVGTDLGYFLNSVVA